MKTFISEVLDQLNSEYSNLENLNFIFPSKRAGRFMLNHLAKVLDKTIFSPKIYSIEEFVEEVSELTYLDATSSIFEFYKTYLKLTPEKEREKFDIFYGWSQTLIQDFNEIDRFLIDPKKIFNYLASIQDLKHWSTMPEQTQLVKNYLKFWHQLPEYYSVFSTQLISKKCGYQGLQYRKAAEDINSYLDKTTEEYIFIGFNALNASEQKILTSILNTDRGKVFWDIDRLFIEDVQHSAGHFLRQYAKWPYFESKKNSFQQISEYYKTPKSINVISVPKNIGQAKYIGTILTGISSEELQKTAVVLADESLLFPLLNSLPKNISDVNITMGIPLSETPLSSLFELLFKIHGQKSNGFYFKDVLAIINHSAMATVMGSSNKRMQDDISKHNRVFITNTELLKFSTESNRIVLQTCFGEYNGNPIVFLKAMEQLTRFLKLEEIAILKEPPFQFNKLFKKLILLLSPESPVHTIKTLYSIYRNSLLLESLTFKSSPFKGLQLMGMLETRALDFETVIISSVNEGILPTGKSGNSFIPHDLKKEFGLPTYKEKDAIYSYHFYRLLQRAKNVYLLYNSIPGDMNTGEKSRFILQLQTEKQNLHQLTEKALAPNVPVLVSELESIKKTPEIIAKIEKLALNGFSPSALLTYIRNPLDFYYQYILGIRESLEVEETIAANTLGTVVHNTLEKLYLLVNDKPYLLTTERLEVMLQNYADEVSKQFQEALQIKEPPIGKNLIALEVSKRYVFNFLRYEKKVLSKNSIEIIALEKEMKIEFPKVKKQIFPIFLKGKSDRIDRVNGSLRIIDYKTGKAETAELGINNWDNLITDYKYSKAFQVLCYAYIFASEHSDERCEAGIISFKNLKEGFMGFSGKKDSNDKSKFIGIDSEILALFETQLRLLLMEICDPTIPFTEKKVESFKT